MQVLIQFHLLDDDFSNCFYWIAKFHFFTLGFWFNLSADEIEDEINVENKSSGNVVTYKPRNMGKGGIGIYKDKGNVEFELKGKPDCVRALLPVLICLADGIDPRIACHTKCLITAADENVNSRYLNVTTKNNMNRSNDDVLEGSRNWYNFNFPKILYLKC